MPKKILLFEYSPDLVELFKIVLNGEGFLVEHYREPEIKVEKIKEIEPDLLMFDFRPSRDGDQAEVIKTIKQEKPLSTIPIIVCSAWLSEYEEAEQNLMNQNIAIIKMPFDVTELLSTVHKVIV